MHITLCKTEKRALSAHLHDAVTSFTLSGASTRSDVIDSPARQHGNVSAVLYTSKIQDFFVPKRSHSHASGHYGNRPQIEIFKIIKLLNSHFKSNDCHRTLRNYG